MPEDDIAPEGHDEHPSQPGPGALPDAEADAVPEPYDYELVDDNGGPSHRNWRMPALLAAVAIVPAAVVGIVVWLFASGSSGGGHSSQDVASILNAFTNQQGSTSTRYEGQLPPGAPNDIPVYPGAEIVSSLRQVQGTDASYLVVYDTPDSQTKVSQFFEDKFGADPWQITGGQNDRNGNLHQFSKTSDPNITGIVLVAGSTGNSVTTILESVQVAAGASGTAEAYRPGENHPLPSGFPSNIPQYPGSTTIESAYRRQAQGKSFAVAFVTKDDASKALDYYRNQLQGAGYTVADATPTAATPAAGATPEAVTQISFSDDKSQTTGTVATSELPEDTTFTRIDVQLGVTGG